MMWNKKFLHKLIVGTVLCCIIICILALYADMLKKEMNNEVTRILSEVSEQSITILKKDIAAETKLVAEIADRLSSETVFNEQEMIDELKKISRRYAFRRMGVIMPDGTTYTTDDKAMNLGDREFFAKGMQGEFCLSEKLVDKVNGDEIIVYSMPIYEKEEVSSVFFATYSVRELKELLAITVFNGEGYSYLIAQNGDCIVDTISKTGFKNFKNVYISLIDASETNASAVTALKAGVENNQKGYITFHNLVDKYMYYAPIGINDWFILNVVPAGVMDNTRNYVMLITYLLCFALSAVFIVMVIYIVRIERQKKKELSDILYVDDVTGGYSYARFNAEVHMRLNQTDKRAAYIIMDIDKFKVINELFGYDEGNKMLEYIWKIWKKCSRDGEIFARRIADRYVALWYFTTRDELNSRIDNFLEELQKNTVNYGVDYNLRATIGIYIIKDKHEDVQNMMNYAMMAHYSIKERGDVNYTFYDDNFRERLLNEKLMEDQMKPALKRREFRVYYQPKYNVRTRELVGAEALIRWQRQDGVMVMPMDFIPLAEKTGFVNHLDKYVYTEVCRKQKEWFEQGMQIVPVSVNLSRTHLYYEAFMEEYQKIMEETGVNPHYVQLELTESAIFENQEALCQIIDKLHGMGFQILMDDFGTGYSSLMMLKSVPIDVLKLDKSFVDDFDDPKGKKIITSVIALAQALQIEVTAEGVETEEQYLFLKELGCNSVQGFYFAKPMPEEEFEVLLTKN